MQYIKAAPWPYMTGGASLGLALGLKTAGATSLSSGNLPGGAALCWWGLCWLVVAVFAMADGVSRYREYRRIKAMFQRYGFSKRVLETVARSRCQRDAALHAARETGHLDKARAYFREQGYRWYHILPDLVVRNPLAFVSTSFLRTSFLPGKKMRT